MIHITEWLDQYGYIVLFLGLMLELVALPVPGEVLMSYSGFLVFSGKLNWLLAILTAALGSSAGITIAYLVGAKLGTPFFRKYGHRIHLGPDKLEKTSQWFTKYGNKMLIIGFFIPGVRHITGYFSGITRIPYKSFAPFAYIGALLWTSVFISLGKVLGPKWEEFHGSIKKYLLIGGAVIVAGLLVFYLYKSNKQKIIESVRRGLDELLLTFNSLGRVKFLLAGAAAAFIVLLGLMLGLIQDYLANEFYDFDTVGMLLVHAIFDSSWLPWMRFFSLLASAQVLIFVVAFSIWWIWKKGTERWLEFRFLLLVVIGAELLDEGLRLLFHRVGPSLSPIERTAFTFPSEQSLMVVTVIGFTAFLIMRHSINAAVRTAAVLILLVAAALVGVSRVYLEVQYPSDVAAGYVFGGVWLMLNIILLEIYRQMRKA